MIAAFAGVVVVALIIGVLILFKPSKHDFVKDEVLFWPEVDNSIVSVLINGKDKIKLKGRIVSQSSSAEGTKTLLLTTGLSADDNAFEGSSRYCVSTKAALVSDRVHDANMSKDGVPWYMFYESQQGCAPMHCPLELAKHVVC
jgi:hypothetical protein